MRCFSFSNARVLFALAIAAASAACTGTAATSDTHTAQMAANPAGLQIIDIEVGTGLSPKPGHICIVLYTGWLYENGAKGAKFDSSLDRGQPFQFTLGAHQVIAGWDEGVAGMKVGGERTLIIPPELGYGERGAGGVIPPNATLMFDVQLLQVQ